LRNCKYVSITELTPISVIGVIILLVLLERKKEILPENNTALRSRRQGILSSAAKKTNCSAKGGGEGRNALNILKTNLFPSRRRNIIEYMKCEKKGNEARNTLDGYERERHSMVFFGNNPKD
jgi:hypothetical protein